LATLYDTIISKGLVDNLPEVFLAGELKYIDWAGFEWCPILSSRNNVKGYSSKLENLTLKLYGSELYIENSLQKYFMGNNYQDFSFTQVLTAFSTLNNKLPIDIYKTSLVRADVGVVINHNTEQECNRWLDYKGKLPISMIKRNTVYGSQIRQTNNKFKAYNKTFEAKQTADIKLQEELIRVELQGNNRYYNQRTNPIGVYTIQDLINPNKFQLLANELLSFYTAIKKKPNFDTSKWLPKEKRIYGYMRDIEMANSMKKYNKETHKIDRSIFIKLLSKYKNDEQENIVLNKLKEKVNFSIRN
jgi:hypothetical protein